jgi:hypothetical protein
VDRHDPLLALLLLGLEPESAVLAVLHAKADDGVNSMLIPDIERAALFTIGQGGTKSPRAVLWKPPKDVFSRADVTATAAISASRVAQPSFETAPANDPDAPCEADAA